MVKARANASRLVGCAAVHQALWVTGFPCPDLLVDLKPIGDIAVSAELLVNGAEKPSSPDLAACSAAGLARLIHLAPTPESVPSVAPSPSWTAWDHDESGLWPTSEELDTDLNDVTEPKWLTQVGAALRNLLRQPRSAPVIGHGDWHPGNLRWHATSLVAVYDWDSVICQPEPAIVGLAAASFRGGRGPGRASLRRRQRGVHRCLSTCSRKHLDPPGHTGQLGRRVVATMPRRQSPFPTRRPRTEPDPHRSSSPARPGRTRPRTRCHLKTAHEVLNGGTSKLWQLRINVEHISGNYASDFTWWYACAINVSDRPDHYCTDGAVPSQTSEPMGSSGTTLYEHFENNS